MLKIEYCYNQYLKDATWRRAKSNDNMISCTEIVLVSASYSRCSILALSLCTMTHLSYGLQPVSLCCSYIYSVDTILYPYALLLIHYSYSHLKSLSKCNLSSKSKDHNIILISNNSWILGNKELTKASEDIQDKIKISNLHQIRLGSVDKGKEVIYRLEQIWSE